MEKRLKEIQERAAAILKEMEDEITAERMTELEAEQRKLAEEKELIERKMNVRGRLQSMAPEEGKPAAGPGESDAEARAVRVKETGKLEIPVAEVRKSLGVTSRSVTIDSGNITTPTGTGNTIRDNTGMISSIVDQVYSQDLTGCAAFEEAYIKTVSEASEREDGKANEASEPTFGIAKIQPVLINVTSYVSRNIQRVNPLAYEEKVKSMAIKALRKKLGMLIANGDGKTFYGIRTAVNTDEEPMYKTYEVDKTAITAGTLREITFQYGGNDELGSNARLFLTKEDLAAFGAVRGTNEKKAIYEITADPGNANTGTIKDGGTIVPYTLMSGLNSLSKAVQGETAVQTMLYGDPENFELGLFGPYSVEVSKDYKFAEGLLTIMGEIMAGGNLVVGDGFVVVTLKAKSA